MNPSKTRLTAISGATLALIVAGTAVVSAHPGGDRRDGAQRGERGERGHASDRFERRGGGIRGQIRQRLGARIDDFVRRETIIQTDDGLLTRRIDNGTVTSVTETSIDYELATGESVSVTIGDETNAIAFSAPEANEGEGRRRFRGPRLRPSEIAVVDIEPGNKVGIWAQSQDDGSFLAQRIVVQPDLDVIVDDAAGSADVDTGASDAALAPQVA